MLFSERSVWTMIHGVGLGGAALMGIAAALFALYAVRATPGSAEPPGLARHLAWLTVFIAAALWLTGIVGTYVVFPAYRATPPPGALDLTQYPRALLLGDPGTAWLHAFAMEIKEHVPWIASILATAVAFVSVRYGAALLDDAALRRMAVTLLAICFALVSIVGLLGIFVNKVAPLH